MMNSSNDDLESRTPKQLGRVGLIGDIHAEDRLLQRALDFLTRRGVSAVLATGDVCDGTGSVDRCIELLAAHQVTCVRGNHDRWLLTGSARNLPHATPMAAVTPRLRSALERLPTIAEFDTPQGRALLCHGLGPNDMARVNPDDFGHTIESNDDLQNLIRCRCYRWVLNGHSHRRMVRHFAGLTIINAGTLTREHTPCFLEVDFKRGHVLAYEFGSKAEILTSPSELPLFEGRERSDGYERSRDSGFFLE
jgi:predicted phosphodiesterase